MQEKGHGPGCILIYDLHFKEKADTYCDRVLLQLQWNRILAHQSSGGSYLLAIRVQLPENGTHLLIHVA